MKNTINQTIKAVLFDLDGTLADTAPDLAGALNTILHQRGLPEKPLADIRPHTGHGVAAMLQFGANITPQSPDFDEWKNDYLHEFQARNNRETRLFDGVNNLLAQLHQHQIAWGIVTNKPHALTECVLPQLAFAHAPNVVVSGDTCAEAKPSPMPLLYACEKLNIAPEHCVYVGDAERDILAGNRAGMTTIIAQWGYIGTTDHPETWGAHTQATSIDVLCRLLFSVNID